MLTDTYVSIKGLGGSFEPPFFCPGTYYGKLQYWSMDKTKKSEEPGKAVETPTREMVREWCKRDAAAAAYFLNMLMKHPDIVERLADDLFAKAVQDRQDKELLKED